MADNTRADTTRTEERERVEDGRVEPATPASPTEEKVVRGRSPGTPFLVLGGVMLTIWVVVALVALGLLLLWWLA